MVVIMFKHFMAGILFIAFIFPILESITGIVLTFLEMIKGKLTIIITQINCQIQNLANDGDDTVKHQIGFVTSFESNEENLDDDL